MTFSGNMWLHDNINIFKKTGPHPLSKKHTLGKTRGGVLNWTPQLLKDWNTNLNLIRLVRNC